MPGIGLDVGAVTVNQNDSMYSCPNGAYASRTELNGYLSRFYKILHRFTDNGKIGAKCFIFLFYFF